MKSHKETDMKKHLIYNNTPFRAEPVSDNGHPHLSSNFQRSVLNNGLRVITSKLPHTNAVSMIFLVGAGSRYENDEHAGVSHLFEHMLFKGTPDRPRPRDISGSIESVGGSINAFTDRECTGYWCRLALPHYRNGIAVMSDIIRNPLFRDEDIAHEKNVVLEEIRASHDSPMARTGMLLDTTLWPDQPLGRDIAGSERTVNALTKDQMIKYHRQQYVASNIVVSVAGNIEHSEVVEQLEELMGGLHDVPPLEKYPFIDNLDGPSFNYEHRDLEQIHMAMAFQSVGSDDPRRHALRLLSIILGGSMSSRLFEEVREKRGLAYGIGSAMHTLSDCGALDIETGVAPSQASEALKVIIDEVVKMRDGVTEEELHNARELAKGRLLLSMEESRAVASDLGTQELLRNKISTLESRVQKLDAVDLDDIKSVANDIIRNDKLAMSVVGPVRNHSEFINSLQFE